ncbi:MAG: DUF6339 family protein [Chloroherpetonaceae bacterium]|nr:DUF6339 family protein [Chloroherpetonaceae bacterium]
MATELSTLTVEEASRRAEERSPDPSVDCIFSPTGGTPVTPERLGHIRKEIVDTAREHGYPRSNRRDNLKCDARIAVILRDRMNVTPHEAAHAGVWEYLSCVLMPDIVVWRFHDASGKTPVERFRSGRRNAFQRLWWRAHVLTEKLSADEAVSLLTFLTEDDMVATMERPGLFGYTELMRLYYSEFRRMVEGGELNAPREAVNRDVHKRLLRIVGVRALDVLPPDALRNELRDLIRQSAVQVRQAAKSARR